MQTGWALVRGPLGGGFGSSSGAFRTKAVRHPAARVPTFYLNCAGSSRGGLSAPSVPPPVSLSAPATSAILSHPVRTPARRNDAESVVYHPAGRVVGHIPQAFTAENTFRTSRPLSVFPLFLTARRDLRLPTKGSLYRRIEKSSRSALESSRTWE